MRFVAWPKVDFYTQNAVVLEEWGWESKQSKNETNFIDVLFAEKSMVEYFRSGDRKTDLLLVFIKEGRFPRTPFPYNTNDGFIKAVI